MLQLDRWGLLDRRVHLAHLVLVVPMVLETHYFLCCLEHRLVLEGQSHRLVLEIPPDQFPPCFQECLEYQYCRSLRYLLGIPEPRRFLVVPVIQADQLVPDHLEDQLVL